MGFTVGDVKGRGWFVSGFRGQARVCHVCSVLRLATSPELPSAINHHLFAIRIL